MSFNLTSFTDQTLNRVTNLMSFVFGMAAQGTGEGIAGNGGRVWQLVLWLTGEIVIKFDVLIVASLRFELPCLPVEINTVEKLMGFLALRLGDAYLLFNAFVDFGAVLHAAGCILLWLVTLWLIVKAIELTVWAVKTVVSLVLTAIPFW